jgi:hypothetical protein
LLRAEGRFEEALDVLDAYRRTLRRADLLDATARDVVATARAAAERTGKPEFITRVLARKDRVVKEREESLALRLLEAQLLEAAARKNPADAGPAVQAYLALSANDGILARAPDGFEVDVGTYACDALRELKALGATVEDPRGNEAAAARAARLKTTRAQEREASFLLLRRPHLAAAVSAGRQLALAAQEDGDPVREAAVIALWSAADPAAASSPEVQERLRNLASLRAPRSAPRGIDELLRARAAAGGGLLEPSFWSTSEEGGILPLSAPESAPLPYVIALAGTKARVIGADGKTIAERVLPDYPDMSEMKTSLEAHIEEPVQVCLAGEMLALATPAGIFGFRGLGPGSDLTLHPKDLKLRWAKTWPHPLGDMRGSRGWGSMNLPTGQNFFPEYSFALANPLVLNREGNLFTVDWSSGKTAWRQPGPGSTPGSPPMMDDAAWIVTRIAHRPAFHRVRRPDPAGAVRRKGPPAVTVEATSDGGGTAADARLVPGALAMVSLSERGLEVYETASGRLLWKRSDGGAQIARVLATEIWLTEAGGRLVRRSLRSGRALGSVQIPQGAQVVDSFSEDTPAGGTSSWTVIASRNPLASGVAYYGGRVQTGTDLFVLKIEGDSKVWETRIHQGPVTYENGRYNTGDGKLLLLFNGEGDEAKWYTRGVLVGPTGELEPLLSVEIHGKGTGQPPRLQVLKDGCALGNADGFGWFVPRGVKGAPQPAGEGAPEKAEQDKSSKQPDAGAPGASREDPAK